MNIGDAVAAIKTGAKVTRPGWGDRVYLYSAEDSGIITYSRNGYDTVWVAPHNDLFAEDWTLFT